MSRPRRPDTRGKAVYFAALQRGSCHTVTDNGDGTYTHSFFPCETPHVGINVGAGKFLSVFDAQTKDASK